MKRILPVLVIFLFISVNSHAEELLEKHVRVLSSEIGARNILYYQNLKKAADYIRREFRRIGYLPEEETFYISTKPYQGLPFTNVVAVKEGTTEKGKIIVVGAHYDTFGEAPGADDNASGVAGVLELARLLYKENLKKTVKFVAFANEETDLVYRDKEMGSYRFASAARARGEDIEAMICLDMIGYFSDEPGSQKYPIILRPFYPDKGNFIGVGGEFGSYDLIMKAIEVFKTNCDIPVESLIAPAPLLPQIMLSDNRPFWTFNYRTVWITDTCIYRNPYMHTQSDTYETIDYKRMSKVVDCTYKLIRELAS